MQVSQFYLLGEASDNTDLDVKADVWSERGLMLQKLERPQIVLMAFRAQKEDESRPDAGLESSTKSHAVWQSGQVLASKKRNKHL